MLVILLIVRRIYRMEQIGPFIDRLVEEREMDEEKRPQLKRALGRAYSKALAEALPDSKLDEFTQLIRDNDFSFEDADRFYLTNGIDMQKIFTIVSGNFIKNLEEI